MLDSKKPRYARILLKLSGEALAGNKDMGIDAQVLDQMSLAIAHLVGLGVQVGIVVGGGNLYRGSQLQKDGLVGRVTGDQMGMLATVMNSVVLQDALEQIGVHTRVMSAIDIPQLAEPFIRRRAVRHLEKQRVVIFAAGTGNPYFTTDSAAALRALEIEAEVIFKATKVDGIYSADPVKDPEATRFEKISYKDVLEKRLQVMDASAISLCMDNNLPIMVFNMKIDGNIQKAVGGDLTIGTLVGAVDNAATGAK